MTDSASGNRTPCVLEYLADRQQGSGIPKPSEAVLRLGDVDRPLDPITGFHFHPNGQHR